MHCQLISTDQETETKQFGRYQNLNAFDLIYFILHFNEKAQSCFRKVQLVWMHMLTRCKSHFRLLTQASLVLPLKYMRLWWASCSTNTRYRIRNSKAEEKTVCSNPNVTSVVAINSTDSSTWRTEFHLEALWRTNMQTFVIGIMWNCRGWQKKVCRLL